MDPRSSRIRNFVHLSLVFACLMLFPACSSSDPSPTAGESNTSHSAEGNSTNPKQAQQKTDESQESLADLIERIEPAVVRIDVQTALGSAVGSGFVIRNDGIIVTNFHVVEDVKSVTAEFNDGKRLDVEGSLLLDPERDVAILKLIGDGPFPTIQFAESTPSSPLKNARLRDS